MYVCMHVGVGVGWEVRTEKEAGQLGRVLLAGEGKAAERSYLCLIKNQELEIEERDDRCNIYSSAAIHCLQKVTFLLQSLMAKQTEESCLGLFNKSA